MTWCGCEPGASPFFAERLHDCVYSGKDALGWAFGMMSLCCWLCATVPQLLENWRNRSVEAVSAGLVMFWVGGDVCNLTGCILGRQLVTQQILGMPFGATRLFRAVRRAS
ncbi:unnamed protein product [Ostreobium quekettii]|uniref:Uncharacterized protein n=1 Tax=Ostreobium quekettii TaxID=121088 RepID=A0A8S1IXY7_9CHLO|nr:unnamed protein product [Ostreobium quekettii]